MTRQTGASIGSGACARVWGACGLTDARGRQTSASWIVAHTSTGAVIRFIVVDTGLYLSLGAERRALRLIQFSTIWGSKLQNQFNLIWYGLTRFTKVNGLI